MRSIARAARLALPAPPPSPPAAAANGIKQQSAPTLSAFKDDEGVWALLDELGAVAATRPGATVAHVALAWLLSRRSVTSVVLGVKTVAQLEENLGALALALTPEELSRIDALSAPPAVYPYEVRRGFRATWLRPLRTRAGLVSCYVRSLVRSRARLALCR